MDRINGLTENDFTNALVSNLKSISKEKALEIIRSIIKGEFNQKKLRFEFSGYESSKGDCTKYNVSILNAFAFLGIYNYTDYLFLDFYKGTPTVYLKYFQDTENLEFTLDGYSTSEIIYEILMLTIFSGRKERRRA